MGVFKAILGLFGLGKADPVASVDLSTGGTAGADNEDPDTDNADESTRDGYADVDEEWADLQMVIQRFEAEGIDLSGLDIRDPRTFWARQRLIAQGRAAGKSYLHSVVSAGFRSVEHWEAVSRYFQAKWSSRVELPGGRREIRPRDEFTAAAVGAHDTRDLRLDPKLLEPVRGVSLELWARASAHLARLSTHADRADIDAALVRLGLDHAAFTAADAVWQERMRQDGSMTIAARFSAALEREPS